MSVGWMRQRHRMIVALSIVVALVLAATPVAAEDDDKIVINGSWEGTWRRGDTGETGGFTLEVSTDRKGHHNAVFLGQEALDVRVTRDLIRMRLEPASECQSADLKFYLIDLRPVNGEYQTSQSGRGDACGRRGSYFFPDRLDSPGEAAGRVASAFMKGQEGDGSADAVIDALLDDLASAETLGIDKSMSAKEICDAKSEVEVPEIDRAMALTCLLLGAGFGDANWTRYEAAEFFTIVSLVALAIDQSQNQGADE